MDEQDIERAVQTVLHRIKASSSMDLRLAKALIDRIEQKAGQMGVRAVVAVSDAAGRPVAVHVMDGA